jgi:hypothetical protein
MASVNQTRPHCVNQMGKTHSKPSAARHEKGMAWARHPMCESALIFPFSNMSDILPRDEDGFPFMSIELFFFLNKILITLQIQLTCLVN